MHALDEIAAVDGAAAGLGGDRARQRRPPAAQFVGADRERAERPLHRRVADPAAGRQALAEADDPREGVDDDESVLGRPRDQQAAIVGAEIERAIGVPGRTRAADYVRGCRLVPGPCSGGSGAVAACCAIPIILFSFRAAEAALT